MFHFFLYFTDYYKTNAGQCQVTFFNNLETVAGACVPHMSDDLEFLLMGSPDFACG